MSTKLTEHESELAKAKANLDDVITRRRALAAEEEELASVVKGWEAIVARERREESGAARIPLTLAVSDSSAVSDFAAAQTGQEEEEEEGENKTQFVRDQIRLRAANGTKPDDLKKAAKVAGLEHPTSWPYGPLQRLKKRGEIIKRKGKYYPGPKEALKTQSNLALVG